jgi:two-component system, chemotaxis family, chemotaxis protein CheY
LLKNAPKIVTNKPLPGWKTMVKKILIVDDSPVARKIILSCLPKDREYEFILAGDGREGVTKFVEEHPDVTFMDITMPVMDGLAALEEIVGVDENAVVVMCTADVQPKSILRANSLGALLVLRKPPTKDTVEEALSKAEAKLAARSDKPL